MCKLLNMHSHQCEGHGKPLYSVCQSLDELEFERGIWGTAMDGNIEKLEKILKDVDPSIPDNSGYTALHYAARNRKEETCKILLQKGANPNAQTHGGSTPIHRAAFVGATNIVSLLLSYKANPAVCDSDGKTALHKAAEGQHVDVIKIIASEKPDLKRVKDNRGLTPSCYLNKDGNNYSSLKELLDL